MTQPDDKALEQLQKHIGYKFTDTQLLLRALTHSSYAKLHVPPIQDNERLEFLGDAVLELVVTDFLYKNYPNHDEGHLTRIRARSVCGVSLARAAARLMLPRFLLLGKSEEAANGRTNPSIAENAVEALFGAVYLDGGYECARNLILRVLDINALVTSGEVSDSKTDLQILVQDKRIGEIKYDVVGRSGPDHNPVYEVEVKINGETYGSGKGKTKKIAGQEAAKHALERLKNEGIT